MLNMGFTESIDAILTGGGGVLVPESRPHDLFSPTMQRNRRHLRQIHAQPRKEIIIGQLKNES
jgi:hypothetical protein